MAIRLQHPLTVISAAGARILLALAVFGLALFFWAISLGGLVALADGDWLPGSALNLTVAMALAALLSCAALAIAPIRWRGRTPRPLHPILPSAGGAPGSVSAAPVRQGTHR